MARATRVSDRSSPTGRADTGACPERWSTSSEVGVGIGIGIGIGIGRGLWAWGPGLPADQVLGQLGACSKQL